MRLPSPIVVQSSYSSCLPIITSIRQQRSDYSEGAKQEGAPLLTGSDRDDIFGRKIRSKSDISGGTKIPTEKE